MRIWLNTPATLAALDRGDITPRGALGAIGTPSTEAQGAHGGAAFLETPMLEPITVPVHQFSPDTLDYISRAPVQCPRCPEMARYEAPRRAEPDCNMPAIEAGWYCSGCGWSATRRPFDQDDAYHAEAEQ